MSEYNEKISAFLDDATQPAELDALVQEQTSGADVGSRYQMIGEALRGEVSEAAFIDVRSEVRQALANEQAGDARNPEPSNVSQIKRPLFDLNAWYRPMGGFAVAASVALVMVFAVIQENPEQTGSTQLASQPNIQQTIVSTPVAVAIENRAGDVSRDRPGIDLETYLAEHAEFAAQDTMMGRMPYVRAVSYESK